jgi:hypothetical protein
MMKLGKRKAIMVPDIYTGNAYQSLWRDSAGRRLGIIVISWPLSIVYMNDTARSIVRHLKTERHMAKPGLPDEIISFCFAALKLLDERRGDENIPFELSRSVASPSSSFWLRAVAIPHVSRERRFRLCVVIEEIRHDPVEYGLSTKELSSCCAET